MTLILGLRRHFRKLHGYVRCLVLIIGAGVLLLHPVMWLVETWENSGYDSAGGHFFVVAAGLALWSLSSGRRDDPRLSTFPWGWIAVAVALRLIGHLVAIPYISGLAIPVAVYALGQRAGLDRRRRPISPFWLAIFVGLTLPVEHVVKRLFGYGLQHLAADGACTLLGVVYADISCAGLDITLRGHELFVDLSCSGARTLLLFSFVFACLSTVVRPAARQAVVGFGLALFVGVLVNSLRISLLTAGLANAAWLGFDVMAQPWHMRVGLICLPVGLVPLVLWARWVHRSSPAERAEPCYRPPGKGKNKGDAVAIFTVVVALVVSLVPQFPVHTSDSAPLELPAQLAGYFEEPRAAGDVERRYFERYGGSVAIADYGPHTLLVVETKAPLRHLHTPEKWLGDAGFGVKKLGHTPGLLLADTYRIDSSREREEGTEGHSRLLDITYISEDGRIATSVAEAIWYWLAAPKTTWRAYLRFHPLDMPPSRRAEFDRQLTQFFVGPSRTGALLQDP